jgi:endoglycosylceramidase
MGANVGLRATASAAALCLSAGTVGAEDLRAEGTYFRDEAGAIVMLRGLNVAGDSKVPPFRPVDDPRLFDAFPDWGVNVARLLFTWEAFEAERGVYDETYFAYYEGLIEALAARGVWVIVDVHQDAFSRFTTDGCGEGMPEWAVSSAVPLKTPDNGKDCASWGIKMILNGDTHRCWDDFYADTAGVRTRYLALLDVLGQRLSRHDSVIGYDMLNEPWGDELKQIGPLYEDAARVLRAHDERAILFTSPQALTSAGQDTKLARPSYGNFAYAPHYYDGAVIQLHTWLGGTLKDPVERMVKQAAAWDVPLLLGEFGAPGEGNNVEAYMDAFYLELDSRFVSATQWSYVAHWDAEKKDGWNTEDFSIVDGAQALRKTYLVRPYPARIAGEPLTFAVTRPPAAAVELSYRHDPALGATRIFAPHTGFFAGDVKAHIEGDLTCEVEHDRRHVRCTSAVAGDVSVRLVPCAEGESCLTTAAPPPASPDAGVDGGDGDGDGDGNPPSEATGDAGAGQDAGVEQDHDPATAIEHKRGGCTLSPSGQGSSPFASLGLAGALLSLLGVRRRRLE